jgi:hypothetical protein
MTFYDLLDDEEEEDDDGSDASDAASSSASDDDDDDENEDGDHGVAGARGMNLDASDVRPPRCPCPLCFCVAPSQSRLIRTASLVPATFLSTIPA